MVIVLMFAVLRNVILFNHTYSGGCSTRHRPIKHFTLTPIVYYGEFGRECVPS